MKPDLQKIQIVPQEKTGPIFAQRESGVRHTPYQAETAFYNCIKAGDCALLERKMEEYFQSGFVVGRLSGDPLRQMQYWAVSSVTLATRAALEGGLDELHAYNFSDRCIQTVDTLQSPEQIVEYLTRYLRRFGGLSFRNFQKRGRRAASPLYFAGKAQRGLPDARKRLFVQPRGVYPVVLLGILFYCLLQTSLRRHAARLGVRAQAV